LVRGVSLFLIALAFVQNMFKNQRMDESLKIAPERSLVEMIFKLKLEESFAVVLTAKQLRERIANRKK
jgi:hypothetical protein